MERKYTKNVLAIIIMLGCYFLPQAARALTDTEIEARQENTPEQIRQKTACCCLYNDTNHDGAADSATGECKGVQLNDAQDDCQQYLVVRPSLVPGTPINNSTVWVTSTRVGDVATICGNQGSHLPDPVTFSPQVTLPNPQGDFKFKQGVPVSVGEIKETDQGQVLVTSLLSDYLINIYLLLVYIAGFLAMVMIVWGGFKWLWGAGNEEYIGSAKKTIISAVMGLILALSGYLILFIVNPNLTKPSPFKVRYIKRIPLDTEISPQCGGLSNDPSAEDCDLSKMTTVDGGNYLQNGAVQPFNDWKQAFEAQVTPSTGAAFPSINYTFRTSIVQDCLCQQLGKPIAVPACSESRKSGHELALAIDFNVSGMSTEVFRELINIGNAHDFRNLKYSNGSQVPDDGWQRPRDEHWHFYYNGPNSVLSLLELCPGKRLTCESVHRDCPLKG